MLDPWIIEEIRRREDERRREGDAREQRIELPLHIPSNDRIAEDEGEVIERGVVIIDL